MNELNYLVVEGVPSSFVFKEKKLLNEKGSGEAKLFIGSKVNEDEFDRFFEFNQGYSYKFDKDNLLEYLNQTKLEYIYQSINQYKDVNISKWNELKELITNLRQSELKCSLKKFVDSSRYYVKSTDDIFKKTLRKLVFPKISDIYFEKNSSDHTVTIKVMVSEDRKNDVYNEQNELIFETNFKSDFPRNKIIFGAPGTGKSYKLNKDMEELLNNGGSYERVTFHPDYSYASFVGTYKPVPEKDDDGNDIITYKYVPGPFMRLYVKAMKSAQSDKPKPHLLIIEEINRASVAAVFGDIFQLLDRKNNISEYPIQTSEDMRYYLASELGDDPEFYNQIKLPDNMFLWATMNSADQGVFPMDTAFKRRWTFEYLDIDANEELINHYYIHVKQNDVNWNCLRKAINQELSNYGINEDKLMGPFFINMSELTDDSSTKENSESTLVSEELSQYDSLVSEELSQYDSLVAEESSNYSNGNESNHKIIVDDEKFAQVFKNKVIMYLFEDAAKQKAQTLFKGVSREDTPGSKIRYSEICDAYNKKGLKIFSDKIVNAVIDD